MQRENLEERELPWWCAYTCVFRERFPGIAFANDEYAHEFWLFLYAKQQPREAMFLSLRRRPRDFDDNRVEEMMPCREAFDHAEFDYLPPQMREACDLPLNHDGDLFVLHGVRMQGQYASTSHAVEPFERVLAAFPKLEEPVAKTAKSLGRRRPVQSTVGSS